jgi:hypothetical protein
VIHPLPFAGEDPVLRSTSEASKANLHSHRLFRECGIAERETNAILHGGLDKPPNKLGTD